MELTFFCFYIQGVLQEALEDGLDMMNVLFFGPGEDEYIIKINKDISVEHVSEHIIYQCLEDGRGIGEAERHYEVFVVSGWGVECRLPLISFSDADEVTGVASVKFGENGGPLEQFKGSGDEWQWVTVLDSDIIKSSVVNVLSFFSTKKNPAPAGDEEGRMMPAANESLM